MTDSEVFLETERLVLRAFRADDARALIDLDSDPEVMRYLTNGEPTPPDIIHEKAMPRLLRFNETTGIYDYFAAIEKKTGDFIGWFHFRPPFDLDKAEHGEMELGYRMKQSAWGKGYATEAAGAILQKGFNELKVPLITARAMVANQRSTRVLEKIGLKLHSYFVEDKFPGEDQRAVKYMLSREDYLLAPIIATC